MKSVKKFATFHDLKSGEKKATNHKLSLKKHNDFEKIVAEIIALKAHKSDPNKVKR